MRDMTAQTRSIRSAFASWPRRGPRSGPTVTGGSSQRTVGPHARDARAEGVEGVWVVQLVTYRVSVAHGLRKNVVFPFFERVTESSVARFGCQGAHVVLAPRSGRCEIPVCTIA